MKQKFFLLIAFLTLSSCSTNTSVDEKSSSGDNIWTHTDRLQHIKNIEDSTTWDLEMLETDMQLVGLGDFGPFELGAFPVPDYDILGKNSFKGIGEKSGQFEINNNQLFMNSFFVEKNELNSNRLGNVKDEVFFQIIVLTDTVDIENYNLNKSVVLSRNHPDYFGQGFIKTKNNRIDYAAFHTAGNDAYAIINTRLFNLNYGKTILIAPQKDNTLRSLQIKTPGLTSGSIVEVTRNLILQKRITNFFDNEASI